MPYELTFKKRDVWNDGLGLWASLGYGLLIVLSLFAIVELWRWNWWVGLLAFVVAGVVAGAVVISIVLSWRRQHGARTRPVR